MDALLGMITARFIRWSVKDLMLSGRAVELPAKYNNNTGRGFCKAPKANEAHESVRAPTRDWICLSSVAVRF
jgi:hypothetical protein